jgi:hypothetical protein
VSVLGRRDSRVRARKPRSGRVPEQLVNKGRLGIPNPRATYFPQTREVLTRLVRTLVAGGEAPDALAREVSAICQSIRPKNKARRRGGRSPLEYAHVISHWYSNPQYLDGAGTPRALSLFGRAPSLVALIEEALPHAKPQAVASALEKLGAVRRESRRYRPTGRYVYFGRQRGDTVAWLLTVLAGVLSSVEHNAYSRSRFRLLGRAAINPYFPIRALPGFHARLSKHSITFLKAVDADMQRKELGRRAGPTTELGVAIFAFEDPLVTGQALRPDSSASKKGRRPPVSQKARS